MQEAESVAINEVLEKVEDILPKLDNFLHVNKNTYIKDFLVYTKNQ